MRELYLLILLLLVQNASMAQWETVYWIAGTPRIPDLNAVKFTDINNGMAVGGWFDTLNFTSYYPIILRTTDSGTSWDTVYSNSTPGFVGDIALIDNSTAIVVGGDINGGLICRTNDNGNTWSISTVLNTLQSVHFPSYFTGFSVGKNGTVMKTTDAGMSWNNIATLPPIYLNSVHFINDTVGFIVGDTTIYKTTDGGTNWNDIKLPYSGYLNGMHFPSDSIGYTFMDGGNLTTIYKTTDCGVTWVQISTLNIPTSTSIWFNNDTTGYITSIFNIRKTTDGGFTWIAQTSSPPSWGNFMDWVSDVYFINDTVGFAVGNSQFYRTYNGGGMLPVSVFNSTSNKIDFIIYPNPSSGNFNIIYLLPHNKEGTLEIFDVTGKIVYQMRLPQWSTLQNINLPKHVSNGVYSCIISSVNSIATKKIVILRD